MQSSTWSGLERPAGISFVSAGGLIVGCLSILASVGVAIIALGAGLGSTAQSKAILALAPAALPVSTSAQQATIRSAMAMPAPGRDGIPSQRQRSMIAAILKLRVALEPSQVSQLDGLLLAVGRQIFPTLDENAHAEAIDKEIHDAAERPARPNQVVPVYFVTAGGRTELHDDGAVFYPADGSATIRASAGPRLNTYGNPILGQEDRQAVVEIVQQASNHLLTAGQLKTVYEMLAERDQRLVAAETLNGQWVIGLNGASLRPDGYAIIQFAGGPLWLSPSGRVVLSSDPQSVPRANVTACGLAAVVCAGSIAMAVWLIMISLGLQHQKILSPKPHRLWSIVKIPLAIVGSMVLGWMFTGVIAAAPPAKTGAAPSVSPTTSGALFAVAFGLAGVVYPVITLIVLRSARSRMYFDGIR